MHLGKYKNTPFIGKIALWAGILAGFGLLLVVGIALLTAVGVPLNQPNAMRLLLLYQDIFLMTAPAVIATCLWSEHPKQWLHIPQHTDKSIALYAALLMIVALPANNLLAWCNQQITLPDSLHSVEVWMRQQEDASNAVLTVLLSDTRLGTFAFNLLVIAVLAAIGEEMCFRGVLQGVMGHTQAAIWVTAIVFSAIHMQFMGFIPRMLMGALFGYMLVWAENIWIPIIMHCVNNAAVTTLCYIATHRGMDIDTMDTFGTGDTLWIGIVSLILVVVGIYFLRRSLTIRSASSRTSKGN